MFNAADEEKAYLRDCNITYCLLKKGLMGVLKVHGSNYVNDCSKKNPSFLAICSHFFFQHYSIDEL